MKALVKYKANVWGISKEKAREILQSYAKRNFDSPGAFKKVKIRRIKGYENQGSYLCKERSYS